MRGFRETRFAKRGINVKGDSIHRDGPSTQGVHANLSIPIFVFPCRSVCRGADSKPLISLALVPRGSAC